MEFVAELETKPRHPELRSGATNPMQDLASPCILGGTGPWEGSSWVPCWKQGQLWDQPRSLPAFSSLALNRGEVCTAALRRPAPLPAWPPAENVFPCVQPEHLSLPPLPPLILQRKDDNTYWLFHKLLTVGGQNQTCGLVAKNTFTRCLENKT